MYQLANAMVSCAAKWSSASCSFSLVNIMMYFFRGSDIPCFSSLHISVYYSVSLLFLAVNTFITTFSLLSRGSLEMHTTILVLTFLSHLSIVYWLGLTFCIISKQLSLSDAHSGHMLFIFMSSFKRSIHLSLGLLGRDPSI